ncbi:hypothetical protein TNCV_1587871 [Trichonephila clavipes]|uniref:Uncharacterized protein n=1 Tax=Trichonephila clavipes TaxID=2585209 RepID=A0A8X6RGC4_TRICX|nr:hypothetical protein TNCV_1587871 [Trichonephila clavipes]
MAYDSCEIGVANLASYLESWRLLRCYEVLQHEKKVESYKTDALKLPNQAPRGPGESLQQCGVWRCPDGTQPIFGWPILAISCQLLASNGPVVDSRDLNLVFGHVEATPNK